jgi:glucosamine-6-phosphate deaminase
MSDRPCEFSNVEINYLRQSGMEARYEPEERIPVIVVASFPELGRLAALRFLEWVQDNPEGLVALPTGKTPEHFIREVPRLLSGWDKPPVRATLEEAGIDPGRKPRLDGLRFVQIDEFYPINPLHHNSFAFYVRRFYLEGLGLDPERAQLIECDRIGLEPGTSLEQLWSADEVDLTLRRRQGRTEQERRQKAAIHAIDEWCDAYEDRIRSLGGIGFFLGGIGPDGHIGFNIRGSSLHSTTRLAATNYETQAAAALDLGGIEVARRRHVITIGLGTIIANPRCVAIILAAGEAKKTIVAGAITNPPGVMHPATVLQKLPLARFYLTRGAAMELSLRRCAEIARMAEIPREESDRILIDISLASGKPLRDLGDADLAASAFGKLLAARGVTATEARAAADRLQHGLEDGMHTLSGKTFLHTEPHHDDILLGYLPLVARHVRDWSTTHHFATLTSGFTAVTNSFMLQLVKRLETFLSGPQFASLLAAGYFDRGNRADRDQDVWHYLDGLAAQSSELMREGEMRRLARNLVELYDERDPRSLVDRVHELANYFQTQYPGRKDLPHIQRLKGMCREWESDCLWGFFGWNGEFVHHLRLGFYKGDMFNEDPTVDRDVAPIADLLARINPDVVTVALDPEASGPDTHYKVMQAVAEALRIHQRSTGRTDIRVLGYRNVWYRFHPSEANLCVPVSLNTFTLQHSAFISTYVSQSNASFPSYDHEGPFSELAQRIQVQQYRALKTCLGERWFSQHPSALIRATRGMVFVRMMDLDEFYGRCRALRATMEAG